MTTLRKERLQEFVEWSAANVKGYEKGNAHVFLDHLFQGFGQKGVLDAGGELEFRIRKGKEEGGGTSFADLVWKPFVLIEMKRRGEDLNRHYRQAFDYWTRLVPGRPRYVVLCNFDEFWVYDFETQMDTPVDKVTLEELPDRYGPLAFLFPTRERPTFGNDHEAVTRDAADKLATCFNKLSRRKDVDRATAQRFILQMLVALFAEDIGLLQKYLVNQLLEDCKSRRDSYDLLGGLFVEMNTPGKTAGGRFKGVDYFNGGLFAEPARVELHLDEIAQLRQAAKADWSKVRPEIFGTLFEHSLEHEERHAFGAHFTSAVDIMKIVTPTIVRPWSKLIEEADTIKRLAELRQRMERFTVLDPACGSGNFLYIAYRELKRLEARIFERMDEISTRKTGDQRMLGFVTAAQFFGIDINPFAVELAKVTMMIARKLAIDELHMNEKALPLDNLDGNFLAADALIDEHGLPVRWPQADVIIGNPPFLDARRMTMEHGDKYVAMLEKTYPHISRCADLCTYWLRKAHDHLPTCTPQDPASGRAGLVGTQNIRNNEAREGGLDHIVAGGTIIEAVDNQPWSGEANVHVSIANWVKHAPIPQRLTEREQSVVRRQLLIPDERQLWFKVEAEPGKKKIRKKGSGPAAKEYELDFRDSDLINAALSDETDVTGATALSCNQDRCYTGQYPRHEGFMLTSEQALQLLRADEANREVVFPFLVGREVLTIGKPERWVIDFQTRSITESKAYDGPFSKLEKIVLPYIAEKARIERERSGRETGQDQNWLQTWWQHFRPRAELIGKIGRLSRYVVCSRVTKRPIFVFLSPAIRPGDALSCFVFEDDYSFGILHSNVHWTWFVAKSSKLKSDFRYTPETVFETFPWPQSPSVGQVEAVAEAGREVRRVRSEALQKIKGGLRAVYRTLELPGKNPLKDAHAALDAAVLAAYGFAPKQDLLAQLLELNLAVAAKIETNDQVTAPGVPPNYPDPNQLITEDCIRP